jgi:hypothetical protein
MPWYSAPSQVQSNGYGKHWAEVSEIISENKLLFLSCFAQIFPTVMEKKKKTQKLELTFCFKLYLV